MAIIEEGENHIVMAAYPNRLCDSKSQIKVYLSSVFMKKRYHFHMNDAGLPVPDKQPVVKYVATLRYHTKEIAAYFVFAVAQRMASRRFQTKYTLVG
jgi:hypothetical protein